MRSELDLLKSLEQQINKLEQFILDLQQDHKWQRIFYRYKLYLNLNIVFNKTYTEYTRYLEDVQTDYKKLKSFYIFQNANSADKFNKIINTKNQDNFEIKQFYMEGLQHKIFALFKVLRTLKNYNKIHSKSKTHSMGNSEDYLLKNNEMLGQLLNQQKALEKMLELLDKQYASLNKQLVYGKADSNLQNKVLNILDKKGKLERELFSIKERAKLNTLD